MSGNLHVVRITDPTELMPAFPAGHVVAASVFLDSIAAILVRACFVFCFDEFDGFCFGGGAVGGFFD